MEKKVRHLGKTLDLKSRTTGTRDQTFWMAEANAHRWASGWGATGSGAMGRKGGRRLARAGGRRPARVEEEERKRYHVRELTTL
jgi:hypothetical protein